MISGISFRKVVKEALILCAGALCIFGSTWLWNKIPVRRSSSKGRIAKLLIGDHLLFGLPQHQGDAVLLVLNSADKFSQSNLSFHKKLTTQLAGLGTPLFIVVGDRVSLLFYQKEFKIDPSLILVRDLNASGVEGTPTIYRIDSRDMIKSRWLGYMQPYREDRFIHLIAEDTHVLMPARLQPELQIYPETKDKPETIYVQFYDSKRIMPLSEQERDRIRDGESLDSVLDLDRGAGPRFVSTTEATHLFPDQVTVDLQLPSMYARQHLPGAINLQRGPIASPSSSSQKNAKPFVLDCSESTTTECDAAAGVFLKGGWTNVFTLDRGAISSECHFTPVS